MRTLIAGWSLALALLTGCDGCARPGEPTDIVGRIWVTNLPEDPRAAMKVFFLVETRDGEIVGAYVVGSQYRNQHDQVRFHASDRSAGRLELLQDGRSFRVRATRCEPDEGYDLCMLLHGDPMQGRRWLSRAAWELDSDEPTPDLWRVLETR